MYISTPQYWKNSFSFHLDFRTTQLPSDWINLTNTMDAKYKSEKLFLISDSHPLLSTFLQIRKEKHSTLLYRVRRARCTLADVELWPMIKNGQFNNPKIYISGIFLTRFKPNYI